LHNYNFKINNLLWFNLSAASLIVIINQITALITLPFVTNNLGINNFALLASALIIYQVGIILMDYGCNFSAIYFVKSNEVKNITLEDLFLPIYLIKIIIFILISIIFFLLNFYSSIVNFNNILFYSILTSIFLAGINPYWIYQVLEKNIYLLISTFFSRMLFLYIVINYVTDELNIHWYFLALSSGFMIINFVAVIQFKYLKLTFNGLVFFTSIIKISSRYFVSSLINVNFNSLWGLGLLFLGSPLQIVYFNLSEQAYRAFNVLCGSIPPNLYSRYNKSSDFRNSLKNAIYLSIIIFVMYLIGFFMIEPFLLLFFNPSYHGAANLIKIYLVASFFLSLSGLFGYPILGILKSSKFVKNIIFFSGYINFIGLIVWIFFLQKTVLSIIVIHLFLNTFIFLLVIFLIFKNNKDYLKNFS
jgi:O-antigen/teichoic acid export membrane protein